LGNSRNLNVNTPSAPGKYRLDIEIIDSNNNGVLSLKYTVYVTHGPVYALLPNYSDGVHVTWLDSAFSSQNISAKNTVAALNTAIHSAGGYYVNNTQYQNYKDVTKTYYLNEANCADVSGLLCHLARLFGIQSQDLGTKSLFGSMIMKPDVRAFDGSMNWWNKTGHNVAGTRNELGAWHFTDHAIALYDGTYYDPTLDLIGNSLTSNVYATIFKEQLEVTGFPGTYRMVTTEANGRAEFRITVEDYIKETAYAAGDQPNTARSCYKYFYIPVGTTSAIATGETKTLAMTYDSAWTAISNDSWLSVSEAFVESGVTAFTQSEFDAIDVIADSNASTQMRTGTITVTTTDGVDTIYVHQDGATSHMDVSLSSISAYVSGKEDVVTISSNVNWIAQSDAEWVELDYAVSAGNNELPLVIAENDTGAARTAEITIEGGGICETITVTQSAGQAPTTYTITYDANGGDGAPAPQTKQHDVSLSLSGIEPQRAGHAFLGWSTDPMASVAAYSAGGTYAPNASATLYAVWEEAESYSYSVELLIDSESLVYYEADFDYDLLDGYCCVYLGSLANIIILPDVYRIGENNALTSVSGDIYEIKYYINGSEYDTLANGELGEFDSSDFWWTYPTISIDIVLTGGTAISCSFMLEVMVIEPR